MRGVGAAGRAWQTLAPVWAPHGERYAAPVVLGEQFRGVLEFSGGELREPDAPLHGTIAMIASQLAQFIERKEGEARLAHQALHDAAHGLPNRRLFHDRVEQAVAARPARARSVAVMLMDLDRFKEVNDTLGHHERRPAAARDRRSACGAALRAGDTVARLGGDEFGFVLPGATDAARPSRSSTASHAVFAEPFELQELPLDARPASASRWPPTHGATPTRCCSAPTSRCTSPSGAAPGSSVLRPSATDEHRPAAWPSLGELRRGASSAASSCCTTSRRSTSRPARCTGVEALVRWQHPERGLRDRRTSSSPSPSTPG